MILLPRRRSWIPAPSAKVNPGHPSAAGLLSAVIPAYNRDLSGKFQVGRQGTGGGPYEGTPVGMVPGSFSTANYQTVGPTAQSIVGALSEFSIVTGFVIRTGGAQTNTRAMYCERGTSGNPICKIDFNISGATANAVACVYRDNSATLLLQSGTTAVNDGRYHVAVMRRTSATTFDVWVDGVRDGDFTSASMTASFTPSANHQNTIGRDIVAGSNPFTGALSHVYLYNRALGTEEIGSLYDDPFGIFR